MWRSSQAPARQSESLTGQRPEPVEPDEDEDDLDCSCGLRARLGRGRLAGLPPSLRHPVGDGSDSPSFGPSHLQSMLYGNLVGAPGGQRASPRSQHG